MSTEQPFDPLATVHSRIDALNADLSANTKATEANTESIGRLEGSVGKIERNTNDIVEFFQAGRGAFKFFGWLATVAKWITAIAAACGVLWAILHGTGPKG